MSNYVSTVVVDRTRNGKTVKNILDELEEKYELTKKEKFEDLVNKIKNFKPSKADSGEEIFGKIEKIQADFKNLDVKNNLNYFLATLFVKEAFENGVVNAIEKRMIQDLVESKNEELIMSEVKKEFKKIRIEGQREDKESVGGDVESKTYYTVGNGRSRYEAWKKSREFRDYGRSGSNNWRTQSGNRWRQSQSKSIPRSETYYKSSGPSEAEVMIEFQDRILKELNQMRKDLEEKLKEQEKKQEKMVKQQNENETKVISSNFVETDFEEEDWSQRGMEFYFIKDIHEVNELGVNCGAPKTLIGESYDAE